MFFGIRAPGGIKATRERVDFYSSGASLKEQGKFLKAKFKQIKKDREEGKQPKDTAPPTPAVFMKAEAHVSNYGKGTPAEQQRKTFKAALEARKKKRETSQTPTVKSPKEVKPKDKQRSRPLATGAKPRTPIQTKSSGIKRPAA